MKKLGLSAALILVVAAAGCPKDEPSDEAGVAGEASDSADVTGTEAQTIALATDGTDMAAPGGLRSVPTAAEIATYASTHVGAQLSPSTCHSATTNNDTVVYTFTDCTGPFGLVHISGTLNVVYSIDNAGIHAHATATDFNANSSVFDVDATATYTVANGTKTLSVNTTGSGTGPLGNSFVRQGSYTVSWNGTTQCITLNGSWTTTAAGVTRSTTVTNLTKCNGFCPANGGSISHTFTDAVTLTITFDGSATADWTTGARSGTIRLICVPAT